MTGRRSDLQAQEEYYQRAKAGGAHAGGPGAARPA